MHKYAQRSLTDPAAVVSRVVRDHLLTVTPHTYHAFGHTLRVPPGVFNPFLAPSGPIAMAIASAPIYEDMNVLDVGCGSGIPSALFVANGRASTVVAIDINPAAVLSSRQNAVLCKVADRVDSRVGDGFGAVSRGERFDLVLADPPFAVGTPASALEHAFFENDGFPLAEDVLRRTHEFLVPGGSVLMIWSNLAPSPAKLCMGLELAADHWIDGGGIAIGVLQYAVGRPRRKLLEELRLTLDSTALREALEAIVAAGTHEPLRHREADRRST